MSNSQKHINMSNGTPAIPFLAHSERSSLVAGVLRRGGSCLQIVVWTEKCQFLQQVTKCIINIFSAML